MSAMRSAAGTTLAEAWVVMRRGGRGRSTTRFVAGPRTAGGRDVVGVAAVAGDQLVGSAHRRRERSRGVGAVAADSDCVAVQIGVPLQLASLGPNSEDVIVPVGLTPPERVAVSVMPLPTETVPEAHVVSAGVAGRDGHGLVRARRRGETRCCWRRRCSGRPSGSAGRRGCVAGGRGIGAVAVDGGRLGVHDRRAVGAVQRKRDRALRCVEAARQRRRIAERNSAADHDRPARRRRQFRTGPELDRLRFAPPRRVGDRVVVRVAAVAGDPLVRAGNRGGVRAGRGVGVVAADRGRFDCDLRAIRGVERKRDRARRIIAACQRRRIGQLIAAAQDDRPPQASSSA